jgi:CDP-paratose 2-epimerase
VLCVDDLIRAFESVRRHSDITRGQVYNVGGGPQNTASLLELISEIETLIGRPVDFVRDEARPGDQLVYVTDYSKLKRDTGWEPQVGVRQTLARIQEWWRQSQEVSELPPVGGPVVTSAMQNVRGAA